MSDSNLPLMQGPVCPIPLKTYDKIVMGHGSGGQMTQDLVRQYFLPYFSNPSLLAGNDFAELMERHDGRIVVSTDAHIVSPIIFPGGDIGRLAVSGTVNDVSMSGGSLLCLTASFILEEGLPTSTLQEIIKSMADAAAEAGVPIIAGDTKVVEKGKADQLFISTTGIGWVPDGTNIGGALAQPGDAVLVSGTLGDHGIAVLSARGELGLETQLKSDVTPLNHLIEEVIKAAPHVHVLRDPTRGGLATTLNEIAHQSNVNITIDEEKVPVNPVVASACEILGFDPLYVANEGKVIVIVPASESAAALQAMHTFEIGKAACRIGTVHPEPVKRVLMNTRIGGRRILDVLAGEMLPRIC